MKEIDEKLKDFDIVTRHLVMERDLNAHGNLFGGVMMAWLDEGAALYVMDMIHYSNFVTVSMEDVQFRSPAHRGDAVVLYCRVVETGRSSIIVETCAFSHEPETGNKREIIDCTVKFVCLKDGKPYPYFESNEYKQLKS